MPGGEIDGVIDTRLTAALEYDASGNLVREVAVAQQTGFPPTTQTTLHEYDSKGNVLASRYELDFNADGTIDVRTSVANIYDSRDRLVRSTSAVDSNGDGTIDVTSVVTVLYDGVK
jgi:hypothetical protein